MQISKLMQRKYSKMKSNEHISVLLNETLEGLNIKPDGIYVDMTLGRAGHSSKILERLNNKGKLIAFDQDIEAITYSKEKLSSISSNFEIIYSNFVNVKEELSKRDITKVDGILYDLGVSSPQFDEDYRGFSYRYNAPLDMRMDLNNPLTAKEVVNKYSLNELTKIFKEYGEERYSYLIAKKIVEVRNKKEINTTFELVDIIKSSIPKKELFKDKHPAKQVFQALRIEVNNELKVLEKSLNDALTILNKNGRIVVITFHSLEDKIVKNTFNKVAKIKGDRHNDYLLPSEIKKPEFILINKKVITPSEEELELNHRAKSAKLRIIERVETKGE